MKNQDGITLVSLIIYIIVMIIVLAVMNSIITNFYNNTQGTYESVEEIIEFNKFNIYFLKEVKLYDNAVDTISLENGTPYILFASGNSFLFDTEKIYYNNIEICDNVKSVNFEFGTSYNEDGEEIVDETIINVNLSFENFSKTMKYKVENIY